MKGTMVEKKKEQISTTGEIEKVEKVDADVKVPENSPLIEFTQIATISGLSLQILHKAAKKLKIKPRKIGKVMYITEDQLNFLLKQAVIEKQTNPQTNITNQGKKEIQAFNATEEIWFTDLAKELNLSKKMLETRCKHEKIACVYRLPELKFGLKYARAFLKKDVNVFKKYKKADPKEVESTIRRLMSDPSIPPENTSETD